MNLDTVLLGYLVFFMALGALLAWTIWGQQAFAKKLAKASQQLSELTAKK